jgi:hypothetical protein
LAPRKKPAPVIGALTARGHLLRSDYDQATVAGRVAIWPDF